MEDVTVVYHADCPDGFTAAYVFWQNYGDSAVYLPYKHGSDYPRIETKRIFFVDIAFSREKMIELSHDHEIVVLDHHASKFKEIGDLPFCKFDMDKSGAMMAWEYFNPPSEYLIQPYSDVPLLIEYIQDRDLWKNALPNTEEIHLYINSLPLTFENWAHIEIMIEEEFGFCVEFGRAIISWRAQIIDFCANLAEEIEIDGHRAMIVNSSSVHYVSELCRKLAKKYGVGMTWYYADGLYHYSLRSVNDVDVSEIARKFGGGGHYHAAGFQSKTRIV